MRKRIVAFEQPELLVPRREVRPRADQLRFRCGKCGGVQFRIHVKADRDHGRVEDLVCGHCLAVFKLDEQARLAGTQEH